MERDDGSDRESVRVGVYFQVMWKIADDPKELEAVITHHRTSDRFSAPPTAFSDLPTDMVDLAEFQETSPHIYSMWMSLERKIDYLIWQLNKSDFEDPGMEKGMLLDLSAGGASLRTDRALNEGDMVHLRMAPPTFPILIVETMAKVLACQPSDEAEGKWVNNLEFDAIHKNDSEDLIAYNFKRQREILRGGAE